MLRAIAAVLVLLGLCAAPSVAGPAGGGSGTINMTVCKPTTSASASDAPRATAADACGSDCESYVTPQAVCWSPATRFPRDPQWGTSDVLDVCVPSPGAQPPSVNRSFFASTDGTCTTRTDGFVVPTHQCVGPFGKPRPWGSFACDHAPVHAR